MGFQYGWYKANKSVCINPKREEKRISQRLSTAKRRRNLSAADIKFLQSIGLEVKKF
jgi:hypothetical protein